MCKMLRPRIIPCLLIHNGGLVKTIRFQDPKYVGDPLNAVRIFNELAVDELMVLDIDASTLNTEPNYQLIANIAAECRMPLCYGGGVKSASQFKRIISLGVEKVSMSSALIDTPDLIAEISNCVGSQSVVATMDVKRFGILNKPEVVVRNGKVRTGLDPAQWAKKIQKLGAGEIVVNSVDRDGMLNGYDYKLVDSIKDMVTIPITVLGGAGSLEDLQQLFSRYGLIGAAAGSLFVLKGKYRAVLITYPSKEDKSKLYNTNQLNN